MVVDGCCFGEIPGDQRISSPLRECHNRPASGLKANLLNNILLTPAAGAEGTLCAGLLCVSTEVE